MNDDRNDPTNDSDEPPATAEPTIPGGQSEPGMPPPPVTPSQDGGATIPPPPAAPGSGPTRPADYYAQPPASPDGKKGCGKWAIGCGVAGCLVGILLIAAIFWAFRSGWPMLMTRMVSEVETHIAEHGDQIDPSVREELDIELDELKRHIEDRDVKLQDMQAVVYSMQEIVGDENITTDEAEEFLDDIRKVNEIGGSEEF